MPDKYINPSTGEVFNVSSDKLEDFLSKYPEAKPYEPLDTMRVDTPVQTAPFIEKDTPGFFTSNAKLLTGFDEVNISEEEAKDEIGFFEGVTRIIENTPTNWKLYASQMTEWLGSYIEFMGEPAAAEFFLSPKKFLRPTGLKDTETGELVRFDNEAYKRDGHDAVENKRYYELIRKNQETPLYTETAAGLIKTPRPIEQVYINSDGSTEPVRNSYAKSMADRHKKSLELTAKLSKNKITDSDGFIDAVKKGEVGDVILQSASFAKDAVEQLMAAYFSGGTSIIAQMGGMSYHDYNLEKANSIYGKDDPNAFEKLVASGQDELATPAAFATIGYVLERAGYKGLMREIMKKSFKGKKVFSLLATGNKEGLTEWGQGLSERMNKSIGKGMSFEDAIKDVGYYMTTEEAWDQYFAGMVGGTAVSAGGRKINAALRNDESGSAFINEKINNIAILADIKARSTSKRRKKRYEDEIQIQETELKEYLESNKDLSNYLSKNQEAGLNNLVNNVRNTRREIKDLNSLFNKGVITKQQFDAGLLALNERMSGYNKGIVTIKNDANMAKLQQDLDASGQLVKAMKGLEQEVYKTQEEFLAALKAEMLAQGGTEQDFINATQDKSGNKYTIDGLKVGNKLLINAKVAAERNATAVGTHEVLHGLLKSTLQENDGSGNLSEQGEIIVQDFLKTLTRSQRKRLDKKLDDGKYKINKDGSEKEFKEYGEEYINFYAQLSKQEELDLSKVGRFLSRFFNRNTEFKKISFETGADTKAFLDAIVADSKEGIYRKEIVQFARQQDLTGDTTVKASMTASQRAEVKQQVDNLGSQSELGDSFREKGVGKFLYDAEVDNIISKIKNEGYLDALIASKFKGDRVPKDFVSKVITELTSHIKNFNPETNDSLFGWINSQLANKAGNVYNREYKADQVTRAQEIGERTEEGEVKIQVEAETDAALQRLEEEDLSITAQVRAEKEQADPKAAEKQSKFRRSLGFETGGKMYNDVLNAASKSIRIAYRKTQNIKDTAKRAIAIRELIRQEYFTKGLTSDIFKPIKNFLGAKPYIKNLKEHREAIVSAISTADFVQMERKIPDNERIFTVFDRKLTSKKDVQDAVNRDLLPLDALNKIDKGQAVNLYRKRMPTEAEFISFADQPAINPETGARSGLKGTRKDGFAKAIANTLVLDATMEVRQSEEVVDALDNDVSDLMELSAAIGREVDVKFSRTVNEQYNKRVEVQKSKDKIKQGELSMLNADNEIDAQAIYEHTVRKDEAINSVYESNADVKKALQKPEYKKITKRSDRLEKYGIDVWAESTSKSELIKVPIKERAEGIIPDVLLEIAGQPLGLETKADSFRTPARTIREEDGELAISKRSKQKSYIGTKDGKPVNYIDTLINQIKPKVKSENEFISKIIGRKWKGSNDRMNEKEYKKYKASKKRAPIVGKTTSVTDFAAFDYIQMTGDKPIPSVYITIGSIGTMTMGNFNPFGLKVPAFEGRPMELVIRERWSKTAQGYTRTFVVEGQMKTNEKSNGKNVFKKSPISFFTKKDVNNIVKNFKKEPVSLDFSRALSPEFNKMLQRTKGVGVEKIFSKVAAQKRGKNIGKFRFFVPPSADDFAGLLRYFVGKGEQGNKDLEFFNEALIKPFARADEGMKRMRQTILEDYKTLRKTFPKITKKLGKMIDETGFTFDNAIRVYLWDRAGFEIPGLSKEDVKLLTNRIKTDQDLKNFAEVVANIANQPEGYLEPGQQWEVESIGSDLQNVVNKVGRKKFLGEWIENKNEIFSDENLNKIEATYGSNFREALENILWRMENGTNRAAGMGRIESAWNNWINGSVGAIMFFNARSAVLQTLSTVNFINFEDNNIFAAAKAFANQKQYWKDFSFLFNSSFLKQRRAGLQTNINEAELASAVAGATNKAKAALRYILKIGFTPTQVADSFAIASGGATYYRNRIKKYIKQGMDQKAAEKQAMLDFQEIAEETQQSARPDRISQQQASSLGRIILAFANTPMQYNRLIKKAGGDLLNKRGDWRSNVSRIIYYGALQNIIFSGLQSAIFALAFDNEEPEEDEIDEKTTRILHGTIDTLLRGSGIAGAVVSTIKNTVLKFMEEDEESRPEFERVLVEALQISPPIGSKVRKIYQSLKTYEYNRDVIPEMGKFDLENPIYNIIGSVTEGTTNLPLARLHRKIDNIKEVFNQDNQTWQRIALALGWDQWSLGIDPYKDVKEAEKELRKKKKKKKKSKKDGMNKKREVFIF